ncbi:hypothetical protein ACOBQX_04455 [Actinokineospora sp. G85]
MRLELIVFPTPLGAGGGARPSLLRLVVSARECAEGSRCCCG